MTDLRRIAFVSAAYPRLRQGIASAPIWPFAAMFLHASDTLDTRLFVLSLCGGVLTFPPWAMVTERWMNRRFGRATGHAGAWWSWPHLLDADRRWWPLLVPVGVGLAWGALNTLDRLVLGVWGRPSVPLAALAAAAAWATFRDWPFRAHLLAFVACCSAAAFVLPEVLSSGASRLHVGLGLAGLWILMRLFDLALLLRIMPRREHLDSAPVATGDHD